MLVFVPIMIQSMYLDHDNVWKNVLIKSLLLLLMECIMDLVCCMCWKSSLQLWTLPVSHAANLTKYNCQFDKGPKLRLYQWDEQMWHCPTPTLSITIIHVHNIIKYNINSIVKFSSAAGLSHLVSNTVESKEKTPNRCMCGPYIAS